MSIHLYFVFVIVIVYTVFNKIRNRDTDKSNVPLLNPESTNGNVSKAKKMWHLAYTIVNNPQLIELRRRDYNNEAGYIDDVNIPI